MAIDMTRFGSLMHAYGRALDTPGHLQALADGDDAARRAALSHLGSAILHQGTAWTATATAARAVGEILAGPRLAGPGTAWLRQELLDWLADVGESAATPADGNLAAGAEDGLPGRDFRAEIERIVAGTPAGNEDNEPWDSIVADPQRERAMWAQILLDIRQAAADLIGVAVSFLPDPSPQIRAAAGHAAAALAQAASLTATPARGGLTAPRPGKPGEAGHCPALRT